MVIEYIISYWVSDKRKTSFSYSSDKDVSLLSSQEMSYRHMVEHLQVVVSGVEYWDSVFVLLQILFIEFADVELLCNEGDVWHEPHTNTISWIEYSSNTFSNIVEPHVWFTASRQNIFHFENKLHFIQPPE